MTTLNRRPIGLLGYLGIKNGGRDPAQLAPVLSPTWDLEQLYLAGGSLYESVTVSGLVVGNTVVWMTLAGVVVWGVQWILRALGRSRRSESSREP